MSPEPLAVSPECVADTFSLGEAFALGVVLLPKPVVLDRFPAEVTDADLVEIALDQHRYLARFEGQLDSRPGGNKGGANGNIDVEPVRPTAAMASLNPVVLVRGPVVLALPKAKASVVRRSKR